MLLRAPKNIAKILHNHSNPTDKPPSPRVHGPVKPDISLAESFESPRLRLLNISPAASTESVVLNTTKDLPPAPSSSQNSSPQKKPHLTDPPPRTASTRRGPPAPIRIPNGRIHAPPIIVERDADLADLENRISISIRTPRVPRKSSKRKGSKSEQQAGAKIIPPPLPEAKIVATNASAAPSASSSAQNSRRGSLATNGDDAMTEASNDEYRFSLGFLLQPDRTSVMTTRTGRADSATLPELSPFFASDSYIPPVPIIPPSLIGGGIRNATESSTKGVKPATKQLKPVGGPGAFTPGNSPLASAYSQLTANSRPYVSDLKTQTQNKGVSQPVDEEEDYSPTFTAASPLDSPEKRIGVNQLSGNVTGTVMMKPWPSRHTEHNETLRKQLDKSPGVSSVSSIPTPELSPATKPAPQSSTSSSGSNSSMSRYEGSISNFEIVTRATLDGQHHSRSANAIQQRHREVPQTAVPMSAVSPGLSTASIDQYLDIITFGPKPNNPPLFITDEGAEDASKAKSTPAAFLTKEGVPNKSTFAPNHPKETVVEPPKPAEPRKLKFPPLEPSEPVAEPILSALRERRPSLPSPSGNISPNALERRPSAPSPLTGGPTAILFTPSAHQPLHAALSGYSSSGFGSFSLMGTGSKLRAVDDQGFRVSNLSIKTDHIRSALAKAPLVPYTPFSQGSDAFSPGTALISAPIAVSRAPIKSAVPPTSALSTAAPVKLATRSRTRPPSGPRQQRSVSASKATGSRHKEPVPPLPSLDPKVLKSVRSRANTSTSVVDLHTSLISIPTTPSFETGLIPFKGLTLDVAKWTFSQEELQEISRRAICQSADPLAIRLVPAKILDEDVPAEMEKLELRREELKADYKYHHRRRVAILGLLNALTEAMDNPTSSGSNSPSASMARLLDELREVGIKADKVCEELYNVCDQINQMHALQDCHASSALAMALRKINASYLKSTAEATDMKAQIVYLTGEREEAWAMAESLEKELNEVKAQLEAEKAKVAAAAASTVPTAPVGTEPEAVFSPPIMPFKRGDATPSTAVPQSADIIEDAPLTGSRVLAARKVSTRRAKAGLRAARQSVISPLRFSALHTGFSISSAFSDAHPQPSAAPVPPVPAIHSAALTSAGASAFSTGRRSRRSESLSGTPGTAASSRELMNAQNELLQMLGVPVQGLSAHGFRRTRSFSDADVRASMLPPSPPPAGLATTMAKQLQLADKTDSVMISSFHNRESRITSVYGAYLSRRNTAFAANKRRQTRASGWGVDAIYDGILDDPATLFAVVKPSLQR
ncbi:hypothetical protein PIIN_06898 [Serendipita indica DSM 11827]|uniref:Uncharacterized protein n=1 Tax=Serendipita indica (strain DSM 11827) TaxID=1109443 RepID=G4TNQ0_SERID|nr:hypothetical protein PIIN_06898 [Serendipita indica DSM 11827]